MTRKLRSPAAERLADMVQPKKRDFTVTEIAKRLGVSRQTVTAWCTGESQPQVEHANALEALLGIPVREWQRPVIET